MRASGRRSHFVILKIAVGVLVLSGVLGEASAQQPTKAQESALRSACRKDFMSYCSKVKPSGPAAVACLQRNVASLTAGCRTAVSALGAGAAPAVAQPGELGATTPGAPAGASAAAPALPTQPSPAPTQSAGGQTAPPQPTKAQESALRAACRKDFMSYCSKVKPSGPAAVACLQRNVASLTAGCRTAVSALGAGAAPAAAPPGGLGATTPAAPAGAGAAAPAAQPSPAPTQSAAGQTAPPQPTKAQESALRAACRTDFMRHCSRVKPSGPAAVACLQRNAASLSAGCRTAVSAIGGGSAPPDSAPAAAAGGATPAQGAAAGTAAPAAEAAPAGRAARRSAYSRFQRMWRAWR
jgi:hypothetical protein